MGNCHRTITLIYFDGEKPVLGAVSMLPLCGSKKQRVLFLKPYLKRYTTGLTIPVDGRVYAPELLAEWPFPMK